MVTKLDELISITLEGGLREQKRWFLKNLTTFKGMTIRATRFGFTAYNSYSKDLVEFSDEDEIHCLPNGDTLIYPRFLFVYKEKFGTCTREIILRDIAEKMVDIDAMLKGQTNKFILHIHLTNIFILGIIYFIKRN